MTNLRRHVVAVVAALFALAVGIVIGGGPLSYIPDDEPETSDSARPADDGQAPTPVGDAFADLFAEAGATRLYDAALLGHPTAILAMPGADPDVVDEQTEQVKKAGGGLTGVFELTDATTDPGETSLIDTLGSQLMTQLGDTRVDPAAPVYVRFGQLVGLALTTPSLKGLKADDSAKTIRRSLETAELFDAPAEDARLAPLLLVVLPPHDAAAEDQLATAGVYTGLTVGLAENAAGLVVLGDAASGEEGLLAELREDDDLVGTVSTVDGADTGLGRVTAMLALIASLDGSVGAYGASGSDGPVPLT